MEELNKLCSLLHEKNLIQERRQFYRHRVLRLKKAVKYRHEFPGFYEHAYRKYTLKSIPMSEIRYRLKEAQFEYTKAVLDIANFTRTKGKDIQTIVKANKWRVTNDDGNNYYTGIKEVYKDIVDYHIRRGKEVLTGGRKEISNRANTYDLECVIGLRD